MSYSVNNTDSSLNFTVQDGKIDSTTLSISLIGTNAQNYADEIARNDITLLENFASNSQPSAGSILTGQLWYDKTDQVLRVYKGRDANDWVNLEPLLSATAPTRRTPRAGERYFDTSNNKFYIYNGASWIPTGYGGEVTSELSSNSLVHNPTKFGAKVRAIFLKDTSGRPHPCMALVYVNNSTTNELYGSSTNGETVMALFNHDATFTADNVVSETEGEQINYYAELNATGGIGTTINKGMNLRDDYVAEAVALATEAVTAQKANALFRGGQVVAATSIITEDISWIPTGATGSLTLGNQTQYFDTFFGQRLSLGHGGQAEISTATDNLGILGSTAKAFADLYTYDVHANANVNVGEILSVTGNSNLTGNVDITNNLQVNQNITGNATITGATLTDGTLQINSGSIGSAINGTFSGTISFGSLNDGAITIESFVDEDNMVSDSATKVPTQQSTKAYVDTANANMKTYVDLKNSQQDLDITTDSGTIDILVDSEVLTLAGGSGIDSSASGTTVTMALDNTVARTNIDETFDANLIVTGNLTVSGTTTTVNSATLNVADNEITLNSDVTGVPSQNAGIEVERGSSTNVKLRWNESTDKWQFTNDGSTYSDITTFTNFSVTSNSASGNGALAYNNSNGVFTFTPADTSLGTKDTGDLAEGSNLYYTDARVLTKIQATTLTNMSDVNYGTPNDGQTLQWNASNSRFEAVTPSSGVTTLINLNDVHATGASAGQVLQKLGNGDFGFGTVSTTNNYADSLAFNTGTGVLTVGRSGLSDLTVNLDGRYGTSSFSGSYNDLSNKPTIYAEPGIFSGGGNPTLASGVTAAEIRSLIGAGTSSSDDTGVPAITSNGSTPSLNTGITGAEVRSLIGAGTSSSDTTYTAGTGLTLSGTEFSLTGVSAASSVTPSSRTYLTGITLDSFGRVTGHTFATENSPTSDTNYYLSGASFNGSGTLNLTVSGASNQSASMVAGDITSALGYTPGTSSFSGSYTDLSNKPTIPTNNNQLTNGAGYITGYTETDTLSTVTGRGASTGTAISITNSTASTNKTTGALKVTGGIGVQGAGYFGGDVVAYASSDQRLKDNIKPIENALEKLQKIRGVEFDWNDKQENYTGHDTGVIAQEVKEVLPEVVTERDDGYLAVKYEKMIGLLVESIKDLKSEVDDLKKQLNEK